MLGTLTVILAAVTLVAVAAGLRRPARLWVLAGCAGLSAAGILVIALLELDDTQHVLALALACLMLGVIVGAGREQRRDRGGSELQRHLARCRRRGEDATVMVVPLSDRAGAHEDATGSLRVTDSAVVRRIGKRWELHAILDGDNVPRDIVEERLGSALPNSVPMIGWAVFPADGLTLEALFDHARAATRSVTSPDAAQRADVSSHAPDDPAPAT